MEIKYVGIDVHQSTCLIVVLDSNGQTISETVIATQAEMLRAFISGLGGAVHVAFEVGTQSAWLYEVLKPVANSITVCDVHGEKRRGSKTDRIDARWLARKLRSGELKAVYQGDRNIRRFRDLAHAYLSTVRDMTRVMNRIKAIFRSWGIPCSGAGVYYKRNRENWIKLLPIAESQLRVGLSYCQLDLLREQKKEAKKIFLKEARRYPVDRIFRKIPGFGPIRTALTISVIGTPHRFRRNRQLWCYSGLAIKLDTSAEHEVIAGQIWKKRKRTNTRGLTPDYNRILKFVYKGAAQQAIRKEPFRTIYRKKIEKGIRPEMALLTIARRLATISLVLWKRGEAFNVAKLLS